MFVLSNIVSLSVNKCKKCGRNLTSQQSSPCDSKWRISLVVRERNRKQRTMKVQKHLELGKFRQTVLKIVHYNGKQRLLFRVWLFSYLLYGKLSSVPTPAAMPNWFILIYAHVLPQETVCLDPGSYKSEFNELHEKPCTGCGNLGWRTMHIALREDQVQILFCVHLYRNILF